MFGEEKFGRSNKQPMFCYRRPQKVLLSVFMERWEAATFSNLNCSGRLQQGVDKVYMAFVPQKIEPFDSTSANGSRWMIQQTSQGRRKLTGGKADSSVLANSKTVGWWQKHLQLASPKRTRSIFSPPPEPASSLLGGDRRVLLVKRYTMVWDNVRRRFAISRLLDRFTVEA